MRYRLSGSRAPQRRRFFGGRCCNVGLEKPASFGCLIAGSANRHIPPTTRGHRKRGRSIFCHARRAFLHGRFRQTASALWGQGRCGRSAAGCVVRRGRRRFGAESRVEAMRGDWNAGSGIWTTRGSIARLRQLQGRCNRHFGRPRDCKGVLQGITCEVTPSSTMTPSRIVSCRVHRFQGACLAQVPRRRCQRRPCRSCSGLIDE